MREQMEDRCGKAEQRAGAEARKHVAELADGRIGEHPLEIILYGADECGDQGCRGADDRHHRECARAGGKQRRRPGDQIDAGRHHGRRMDQGAGRGRALHGVGQPDMQRKLCAFAAGCKQEEQADGGADSPADISGGIGQPGLSENARHDHTIGRDRVVEVKGAVGHPEEEDRDRKAKVPDAIDEEGLLGSACSLGFGEPEADQQVAAGAHRLPEDVDQQEVAGGHEHRHREDKHRDKRKEPGIARIIVHVAGGIDGDEQADAGDDRQHRGSERIEPQRHRDREGPHVLPGREIFRCESRIGRRATGGGRVGRVERGPLPERRDHFHGPDRLGMVAVSRTHVTGGRRQQCDRHDGSAGDAEHGRQVGLGPERAAQKHGENRAQQGQERHEHQQRRKRKFLHGECSRRMNGGWEEETRDRKATTACSDVASFKRLVVVGRRQNAGGSERGKAMRDGVDRGYFLIDCASDRGLAERLPCRCVKPTGAGERL